MASNPKILKALKLAITQLDSSLDAEDATAGKPPEETVWHAAAEVEYALFLFSVSIEEETQKSKWKINPKLKKAEVKPLLVEVQSLLETAEKKLKNDDLLNAYKNASIARDYLLRIQKRFTKEKREALKKKKSKEK
ncbi:MAG: hypothetical protein PVH12_09080 [Candidatus Bathyarchaeota archaeon]|jgi:hypothetical protein